MRRQITSVIGRQRTDDVTAGFFFGQRAPAQAAAGEGGDLLPGVCALVEAWLGDVALAGLRGASPSGPLLGAWFDDRRVALDLKVLNTDTLETRKRTRAIACKHSCLPIAVVRAQCFWCGPHSFYVDCLCLRLSCDRLVASAGCAGIGFNMHVDTQIPCKPDASTL